MGNSGSFKKGQVPPNKGKKIEEYLTREQISRMEKTQFKEGELVAEKAFNWKGGVQEMTNDCVHVYDGVGKRKRRPRKIYEENFGAIPKGYIIFHRDGNKDNDSPENLEAISRAELVKRNKAKNR